jgi:hypothetical protein
MRDRATFILAMSCAFFCGVVLMLFLAPPSPFTCSKGQEPEMEWLEDGSVRVTGRCVEPAIKYIPPRCCQGER